ncbi:MAG: lysine biosynthesis protein LysX [Candidatus Altiarchaeota archaeon]
MKIGFLHSRIRLDEKMLLDAAKKRGLNVEKIDDREFVFDFSEPAFDYDVVIERCISHSRAMYSLRYFKSMGIPTVNKPIVAQICGDKILTSAALVKNKVPTPRTMIAFTPESALAALEEMGYPAVLKPAVGSWARLIAKVNDPESAESILEHKSILGSYHHSIYYIQDYVEKPGRDIRGFVVGDETVAAIYRKSDHWITNTARGGKAENCPVTDELNEICLKAAEAVGGGVLGIDVMESKDDGLQICEVNYTTEFRNSVEPTGVDIPGKIMDYVVEVAKR